MKMKRTSSLVWRFFDRVEENNRCIAVLCKLCETEYKYFGNTTNLRTHLVNKHPIQWDLLQNGTLDESKLRNLEDDESTNQTTVSSGPKRRKYVKNYKNENVDVLENVENDNHQVDGSDILVRQMHTARGSDEEWLDEDMYRDSIDTYEPPRKKVQIKRIKREVQSPPHRHASSYVVPKTQAFRPERIVIDNSPKKDEYSVFGEYVANKLRKFKGAQTRGNIQQLITTILWQAEYGMYDNMESVKRIILHSVQDMVLEQPQQVQEENAGMGVQMVIEHRGDEHVTEEPVRIIDMPSE